MENGITNETDYAKVWKGYGTIIIIIIIIVIVLVLVIVIIIVIIIICYQSLGRLPVKDDELVMSEM